MMKQVLFPITVLLLIAGCSDNTEPAKGTISSKAEICTTSANGTSIAASSENNGDFAASSENNVAQGTYGHTILLTRTVDGSLLEISYFDRDNQGHESSYQINVGGNTYTLENGQVEEFGGQLVSPSQEVIDAAVEKEKINSQGSHACACSNGSKFVFNQMNKCKNACEKEGATQSSYTLVATFRRARNMFPGTSHPSLEQKKQYYDCSCSNNSRQMTTSQSNCEKLCEEQRAELATFTPIPKAD